MQRILQLKKSTNKQNCVSDGQKTIRDISHRTPNKVDGFFLRGGHSIDRETSLDAISTIINNFDINSILMTANSEVR